MSKMPTLFTLALLLFAPVARAADTSIAAPGAKLEKLSGGFQFTEGPATDAQGNIYFTDQPNDRIMIWSTDGKLSEFMKPCGRSNGLCFDAQGKLWACADEKNELWCIDVKTKEKTVVIKDFEGKLLNGPNDVWIRPDGGVYFSDPFFARNYWQRPRQKQIQIEGVYYLAPGGKQLVRVVEDLSQPNGIIGTPDGKTLYVADMRGRKTFSYDIQPDGTLKNKKPFCNLGSDGMTIDDQGNVYLTGQGVTIFNREGKQIEQINISERTANICFGGKDRDLLFITAGTSIYGLKTKVHGVGSQ
jgi:gluconolactonase